MQFCLECGGALNLFESNDDKLCWSCVRKKDKHQVTQPVPQASQPTDPDELAEAHICFENNMLVIKAKEGWVLWSGPATQPAAIGAIMQRARQIYRIRKKRHKKSH